MKVAATGAMEAEFGGYFNKVRGDIRRLFTANNFDRPAPTVGKVLHHSAEFAPCHFVFGRVGQHRNPTCLGYPIDHRAEIRPILFDITRFAGTEVAFECLIHIAGVALIDQKTGKVRTPQLIATGVAAGTFQRAGNSEPLQAPGYLSGPLFPHLPLVRNRLKQYWRIEVNSQTYDMNRSPLPLT